MSLLASAKGGSGDFAMTPEGTYIARCFKIIDLGTQKGSEAFGGKEQHKVMVSWELLDDVKMDDGRPFSVSQFYTMSLHEKATLRRDLEAWRGRKFTDEELDGFDLKTVLGAYCMLQVVHSADGKYANVNAIMAHKGDKPTAVNPNVSFDLDEPDMTIFDSFGDGLKLKIQASPEWEMLQRKAEAPVIAAANDKFPVEDTSSTFDGDKINLDDIPF